MNCYDCTTQDHLTRAAVGVCADCGAAVCEHHAVVRQHHLTRTVTMMREVPVGPAGPDAALHHLRRRVRRRPRRRPRGAAR